MSYSNNPLSILPGTGISISPSTGSGANQITISSTGVQTLAVRIATATPIAVSNADDVISVEVPGSVAVTVTLPTGVTGRVFNIKDGLGLASVAAPITITPATGTIDGGSNTTIDVPFGSLTLVYSGVEWKIL